MEKTIVFRESSESLQKAAADTQRVSGASDLERHTLSRDSPSRPGNCFDFEVGVVLNMSSVWIVYLIRTDGLE